MTEERSERHRTASPSQPPPRPRSTEEAIDRLQALETRVLIYEERVDGRLNNGSRAMTEMNSALAELKPKRLVLTPWAGIVLAIAGIVFAAGNYPDRTELEKVNQRLVEQLEGLRGEVRSLERSLIEWRAGREAEERAGRERLERIERRVDATARRKGE